LPPPSLKNGGQEKIGDKRKNGYWGGDEVEEEARVRGSPLPPMNPITRISGKRKGREGDGNWGGDEVEEEMKAREERRGGGATQQPGVCEGERGR
jgi:hypothetical protein